MYIILFLHEERGSIDKSRAPPISWSLNPFLQLKFKFLGMVSLNFIRSIDLTDNNVNWDEIDEKTIKS